MAPRLRLDVPLDAFPPVPGSNAGPLSGLLNEVCDVVASVAKQTQTTMRLGKIVSANGQTEIGVFLERGASVGASVGLTDRRIPSALVIVDAASRTYVRAHWASLALGLVAGFPVASRLHPIDDAKGALALALMVGVAIALGLVVIVRSLSLGMNKEQSLELADTLAAAIDTRLGGAAKRR